MAVLDVALLQLGSAGRDRAANRAKGEAACRRAAAEGAHVVLFPEMWSIGYRGFDPADRNDHAVWAALAEPADGPFVSRFQDLARDLGVAVAITHLEAGPDAPRNALHLFDARGNRVFDYAKTHLCHWNPPDSGCSAGMEFPVARLDTPAGSVAVGAMICFDREFPEPARLLRLAGVELILVPNACPLATDPEFGDLRLAQLRGRAFENAVAIAVANYATPEQDGASAAFSPDGRTIASGGRGEAIVHARIDLDALRAFRRREHARDEARRPELYGPIAGRET